MEFVSITSLLVLLELIYQGIDSSIIQKFAVIVIVSFISTAWRHSEKRKFEDSVIFKLEKINYYLKKENENKDN